MSWSAFAHLLPETLSLTSAWSGPWGPALAAASVEAVRGVGRTHPNPAVGCVLVDTSCGVAGGEIVASGHHKRAGEGHAEVNALDALVSDRGVGSARGLTAVVTLEPCAHHGRTPPCADRLVREGVARVVVGTLDPNPRVDGRGIERLKAAGIEVVVADGVAAQACAALIAPFAKSIVPPDVDGAVQRPWVVLKTATSLDGRVATRTGASRFITGAASRRLVHGLRDAVDAVLVGATTVEVDDPALTVRDHRRADATPVRDPRRVILDRRCRLPVTARVFDPPGALLVHEATSTAKPMYGVEHVAVEGFALPSILSMLQARGLTSVLVEAGPRLSASLLSAGLVDELWWFHAPVIIGGDGAAAVGGLGVAALAQAKRGAVAHRVLVGEDVLLILTDLR